MRLNNTCWLTSFQTLLLKSLTTYLTLLQILKIPQAFVTNACGIFRIWRRLSVQQFEMMSQTQQVLFNVNVALVDPASYENARPLIKEVFDFFTLSMESMELG